MEFSLAGLPESGHRMFFRGTDIGRSVEESQHTPGLMTGSQGSRPILLEERRTSEQSEIKILWGRVPNFIRDWMVSRRRVRTRMKEQAVGVSPKPLRGREKAKKSKVEQRHIQVFGSTARKRDIVIESMIVSHNSTMA